MSSTSRTGYVSNTPDKSTFQPLISSESSAERTEFSSSPVSLINKHSPLPATLRRWGRTTLERASQVVEDNTGLLLATTGQAMSSFVNVIVKYLNNMDSPIPTLEIIWVRMAIGWACCVAYMLIMKIPDPFLGPKGFRLLLVSRGFFGFISMAGGYYALEYLSLSDATVLQCLVPTCTTITAAIILKEKLSWKQFLAGLFSLFGVVLIARPEFLFGAHQADGVTARDARPTKGVTSAQRLIGVGAALAGVVSATIAYTSIRAIGMRAHALHSLASYAAQSVIGSTIGMLLLRIPVVIPAKAEWVGMMLTIGFLGTFAQFLLTAGLQRETAGRGTMALYVQIVFSILFERIFFHTVPTLLSIIGMVIITSSAIYVALTKETAKGKQAILPSSSEDISLEESLLNHQEDEEDRVT